MPITAVRLGETSTATEAQLPEYAGEQIQIMREMNSSLKGIEQALQNRCP